MVQRKLPAKLTLQPIPSSLSHHHDLKSPRGADLKSKKMKKSGSIKRPKQPGKPPPTATPLPNYMKPTTSSDARKEQSQPRSKQKLGSSSSANKATKAVARTLTKNPSFKPARATVIMKSVICENLDAQRATCSSTLKDSKFPAYLSLSPGGTESMGTSAIKVCPYTYCSLNGHHRDPLPPLKCFLSAIKSQRGVKLGCSSPRRVQSGRDDDLKSSSISPEKEEQSKEFFVEIYTADGAGFDETVMEDQEEQVCYDFDAISEQNQEISFEEKRNVQVLSGSPKESTPNDSYYEQDSDGSDMEWETGYCSPLQLDYDYGCMPKTAVEPDPETNVSDNGFIKDEFIDNSDGKDCWYDENLVDEVSQESFDEEGFSSDSDDGECTGLYDDDLQSLKPSEPLQVLIEEAEVLDDQTDNQDSETSFEILNHAVAVTKDESTETETGDGSRLQFIAKSKKVVQDSDELGDFNPRGPNFLPLEPDPEAQKVDLRHQDLDERKNAEEWMVDYALRQVVTKLGPARKKKVSLLVEAFEKVMPATKWDLQLRPGSAFDQAIPIQACR